MNANELFEIVKDVPREAWPQIALIGDNWVPNHPSNEMVEAAFIGTMTMWLIGCGYFEFEYELHDDSVSLEGAWGVVEVPLDMGGHCQTVTKLLAAACKAVGT